MKFNSVKEYEEWKAANRKEKAKIPKANTVKPKPTIVKEK